MTPELRAAIAALCISDHNGLPVSSLYDHEADARRTVEARVWKGRGVSHDRESGDALGGDMPRLWHAASQSWVNLAPAGAGEYDGHLYADGTAFKVRVEGAVAHVWVYGSEGWSAYTGKLLAAGF